MASKKGKSNSTSKATPVSTDSEKQGVQSNSTKDSDLANSSVTSASAEATNVKSDDVKADDVKDDDAKGNNVKNGVKAENSSEKDTHQATDSELEPAVAVKGKAKSARTSKKTGKAQEVNAIDHQSAAVSEAVAETASETPAIEAQPQPISKKAAKEQSSEKTGKKKRLTLDISKSLHKAIKARAVEEGIPMVDMLRSLLEENYGK